jgi:hypothetical protein
MIVKTRGSTADEAALVPSAMVAATLGEEGFGEQNQSPGTRANQISMLRDELLKAKEYLSKQERPAGTAEDKKDADTKEKGRPPRDLRLEAVGRVLKGEMPLLVTVQRDRDIMSAIRLGKEFNLRIVLDGASEAALILDKIRESGYPVILHPTMLRSHGPTENLSFETAAKLQSAASHTR